MGMANAYLIEGDDGMVLIDAGFPNKQIAVFDAIGGFGRSPDQLKHLIFTHGHPDHIGSAAAIVRETGARTYMISRLRRSVKKRLWGFILPS
jgi:glyoxylase-like metal-dependent hydrolase (beta-lactamase superfamily II)